MPACRCTVLAYSADDLYEVATFPFRFEGDYAPGAMFAFPLERELESVTGRAVDDPAPLLADDRIREALARKVALLAAGYVTRRGGTACIEEARQAVAEGLAACEPTTPSGG